MEDKNLTIFDQNNYEITKFEVKHRKVKVSAVDWAMCYNEVMRQRGDSRRAVWAKYNGISINLDDPYPKIKWDGQTIQ